MSVAEQIMQKLAALPEDRQREVLTFVEQLESPKSPLKSLYGAMADRPSNLSLEDFLQARAELAQQWRNRLERLEKEI